MKLDAERKCTQMSKAKVKKEKDSAHVQNMEQSKLAFYKDFTQKYI